MAGSLDGYGHDALVSGAGARPAARRNLGSIGYKAAQFLDVLIRKCKPFGSAYTSVS